MKVRLRDPKMILLRIAIIVGAGVLAGWLAGSLVPVGTALVAAAVLFGNDLIGIASATAGSVHGTSSSVRAVGRRPDDSD